jgi:hypothetical protein
MPNSEASSANEVAKPDQLTQPSSRFAAAAHWCGRDSRESCNTVGHSPIRGPRVSGPGKLPRIRLRRKKGREG